MTRLVVVLLLSLAYGSVSVPKPAYRFDVRMSAYDGKSDPLDVVVRGRSATARVKGRADTVAFPMKLQTPAQFSIEIESGEIVFESRAASRWVAIDVTGKGGAMNGAGRCLSFAVREGRATLQGVACPGA